MNVKNIVTYLLVLLTFTAGAGFLYMNRPTEPMITSAGHPSSRDEDPDLLEAERYIKELDDAEQDFADLDQIEKDLDSANF